MGVALLQLLNIMWCVLSAAAQGIEASDFSAQLTLSEKYLCTPVAFAKVAAPQHNKVNRVPSVPRPASGGHACLSIVIRRDFLHHDVGRARCSAAERRGHRSATGSLGRGQWPSGGGT